MHLHLHLHLPLVFIQTLLFMSQEVCKLLLSNIPTDKLTELSIEITKELSKRQERNTKLIPDNKIVLNTLTPKSFQFCDEDYSDLDVEKWINWFERFGRCSVKCSNKEEKHVATVIITYEDSRDCTDAFTATNKMYFNKRYSI